MTAVLDRATALLPNANVKAFLRVIREGESNQTDDAYRMANVGGIYTTWVHPWYGKTTTEVGHSTAFGAYQFLGTSFKEAAEALGFGNDASPINQDLCAVWTIDVKRHALADVEQGNLAAAVAKLADEWVSLPGMGLARIRKVFAQFGGVENATAPIEEQSTTPARPEDVARVNEQERPPMGIAALLQIFGPILSMMIPQVGKVLNPPPPAPGAPAASPNLSLAQMIFDVIIKAVSAAQPAAPVTNIQGAVEAMQANKDLQKTVQSAVVNEPSVMALLEVGGGIAAAREADLKVMASDKPFWQASAVFWVSMALLPMVYWLVGSLIAGGIAEKLGPDLPVWAKVLLGLFGVGWTGEARSGGFNLVVGLVLGGICGVYFGISVTQQKQQQAANAERAQ